MSVETATEARERDAEDVEPACSTSLLNGSWETKEAAVFPPGYPRLCPDCFGDLVPSGAWQGDGTADWPHTEEVEDFVRSSEHGHSRLMHRRAHEHDG